MNILVSYTRSGAVVV